MLQMVLDRGKIVVPHCWRTCIGVVATTHVAAASPNCRFIEFLPAAVAEPRLRRELAWEELQIEDGKILLPRLPGLGLGLNSKAVAEFSNIAKNRYAPSKAKEIGVF